MPFFTPRQLVIGTGLVALAVLLFSCAAVAPADDGDDCHSLGLAAVAGRTPKPAAPARPAASRVPMAKTQAPARTARPAPASSVHKVPSAAPTRTVTAHPHHRGHGVDVDLDVC
ncbi:hypothetical protein [Streptomyces sp. SAI-127]|uniref:hypothetical protein n=1 Tax=Streptomyces sp. SAI-127 TaxID=2940543 RepID=UPI0024733B1A|nr:hypothetical protein [Streptomyces sp. SAI-127]MDH6489588.1 hypothetical protein [Streptomyces sp. SAI-127]